MITDEGIERVARTLRQYTKAQLIAACIGLTVERTWLEAETWTPDDAIRAINYRIEAVRAAVRTGGEGGGE